MKLNIWASTYSSPPLDFVFSLHSYPLYLLWLHSNSVQFSPLVMSNSRRPHELQHARPPCPSPTPRVYSNSCPLGRWCHPTISSSVVPFSSCPQSFPVTVFSNESFLCIRWPKYWSFSFSISLIRWENSLFVLLLWLGSWHYQKPLKPRIFLSFLEVPQVCDELRWFWGT